MGEGESPRVFGPCLSSSFVPKLWLFSWPSFSRFVHPWAQSRAQVRKGERKRVILRRAGKRTKYVEEEEEVSRNMVERRKKKRRRRKSADEEEGLDGTYGSPCNR